MSVNTCIEQLLEVEAARGQGVYAADTLCCGVARLGCDDQVRYAARASLAATDNPPPSPSH
jgi:diphthamide biosynthesis methyltransferase